MYILFWSSQLLQSGNNSPNPRKNAWLEKSEKKALKALGASTETEQELPEDRGLARISSLQELKSTAVFPSVVLAIYTFS